MAISNINSNYIEKVPSCINEALESISAPDTDANIEKIQFIFAFVFPKKDADGWNIERTTRTTTFPNSFEKSISECKEAMLSKWNELEGEKALQSLKVVLISSTQHTNSEGELVTSRVTDTISLPLLAYCTNQKCASFETTARKLDHACNGCNKVFYCSEECRSADSLKHKEVCVLSGNGTKAA